MARTKSKVEIKSHQQHLLMTPSEVEAIDKWRFAHHISSRGEAIRRLCQNGIAAHEEIVTALDEASDLWDEVVRYHHTLWTIMMQVRGRHEYANPPLPAREWSAEEVVDRSLEWTSDLIDQCHVLYLDLLILNNRVISMSNAPKFADGAKAALEDQREIEQMREEVFRKREEGAENRRLAMVMTWLQENGKYDKIAKLGDENQEEFWNEILDVTKVVSNEALVFNESEKEQVNRRNDEPYDFTGLADFIAVQVVLDRNRDPQWYEETALRIWPNADTVMIRIMLKKALATVQHIDPASGMTAQRLDALKRIERLTSSPANDHTPASKKEN